MLNFGVQFDFVESYVCFNYRVQDFCNNNHELNRGLFNNKPSFSGSPSTDLHQTW